MKGTFDRRSSFTDMDTGVATAATLLVTLGGLTSLAWLAALGWSLLL